MARENDFELASALQLTIRNMSRGFLTLLGKITDVNDDNTCDIEISGTPFSSVPLCVLLNTQASFYPIPVIGTGCLVTFKDGDITQPQILQVDKISTLKINATVKVEFNGGTLDGMVKVNDLVTQMNKIEENQNKILDVLKSINIPNTPYPFAPLFSAITDLTKTTKQQLENTKITQ